MSSAAQKCIFLEDTNNASLNMQNNFYRICIWTSNKQTNKHTKIETGRKATAIKNNKVKRQKQKRKIYFHSVESRN